eukprot:6578195-Prymnesium_polylepis.1
MVIHPVSSRTRKTDYLLFARPPPPSHRPFCHFPISEVVASGGLHPCRSRPSERLPLAARPMSSHPYQHST